MGLATDSLSCVSYCTTGYLALTLDKCIADCSTINAYAAAATKMCVTVCNNEEWLDTSNNKCRYCAEAGGFMEYCTECNATN